jgi:hypothetical protein
MTEAGNEYVLHVRIATPHLQDWYSRCYMNVLGLLWTESNYGILSHLEGGECLWL